MKSSQKNWVEKKFIISIISATFMHPWSYDHGDSNKSKLDFYFFI